MCPTDGVPTVRADFDRGDGADATLGRIVAGRFRVERLLGQGGSGRVYRAVQLSIERPVALKLLQSHHARDRVQVRRFYREARAATRLTGTHVVRVYDFGVDDETRTPFIAMELLEGATLRELIAARGPLPWRTAAAFGTQIAQALIEAGEAGIVHRDLKPANIMCGDVSAHADLGASVLKVMDFGVAKDLGQGDTDTLTAQGVAVGTPAYMAPEQVSGGLVEPRTDLYALGCILFELVTGRPPFDSDARAELYVDHLLKAAPALPAKVGDDEIPASLIRLVAQLLEKSPADRPADARSVAAQLAAIAAGAARAHPTRRGMAWGIGLFAALGIGAAVWSWSAPSPDAPALAAPTESADTAELPRVEHLVVRGAAAQIRLHEGPARAPSIVGDAARVSSEIDGGRLTLAIGAPKPGDAGLVIDVWSPLWRTIKVTGAATISSATPLTASDLSLGLTGTARADLELIGSGLTTSIRGSSEVSLRGSVDHHEVRTGGASRLDARNLVTQETSLTAGGTSDATVLARVHLDLRNEGTGEIAYIGTPPDLTTDGAGITRVKDPP